MQSLKETCASLKQTTEKVEAEGTSIFQEASCVITAYTTADLEPTSLWFCELSSFYKLVSDGFMCMSCMTLSDCC